MTPGTSFDRGRALSGVLFSLAAAATFGIFAPAAKAAMALRDPLEAAGLTYLVAGAVAVAAAAARRLAGLPPPGRPMTLGDAPRLLGMTLVGGVVGPFLFFSGVRRVAGHDAAILQHLEFGLTVLAAVVLLKERVSRRGMAGLGLVASGLLLLSMATAAGPVMEGSSDGLGFLLIAAASLAWAGDNTLARGASDLDPLTVVGCKGALAGLVLLAAAGGPGPLAPSLLGPALLAGGAGVGLSLVLELLALRRVGAALNAGLFATGPAFGFLWSLIFLGERAGVASWCALSLCLSGAVALALDRHGHRHAHEPTVHTHRHHHLDGHHMHAHEGADPALPHVHEHCHEPMEHSHPHVHDDQHRHGHSSD